MTAPTDWVELTASCGRCGHQDSVSVTQTKYTEWKAGANIEWVFKNLSPQQREILMGSDTTRPFPYYLCAPCWDHTFKEEDE